METVSLSRFDQPPHQVDSYDLHIHHSVTISKFCLRLPSNYLSNTSSRVHSHHFYANPTYQSLLPGQLDLSSLLTDSPLQMLTSFQSVTQVSFP